MSRFYYDLHIHSCLSPCADNDMTPGNIAGMATLAGLDIAALTDHNSVANCPAFFSAAAAYGIVPIAGMELTTAEDIHVVCLFETLDGAISFDRLIEPRRIKIDNRPDIFGEQIIIGDDDEPKDYVKHLLINAVSVGIDEVPGLVTSCGGVCYPAHVDRSSNGIIAVLGTFPDINEFLCAEYHDEANIEKYKSLHPALKSRKSIVSSDAHRLCDIRDAESCFELDADRGDPDSVRRALFKIFRGDL